MKAMARTLPPSVLIRRRAPKGQVMHALVRLAYLVGEVDLRLEHKMLSDIGVAHLWSEYTEHGVLQALPSVFLAAVKRYEALVGWTEERMP